MDWGHAATIAGVGIGMVAVALVLLALATWLTGALVRRTERKR